MNAPTAKFDLKKANAASLNDHLADLQTKAADHNTPDAELDKIHQEITATYAAIRSLKKNREGELTDLQTKIKTNTFSIKELFGDHALDLFSDHELTLAAQSRGLFKAKAEKPESKGKAAPKVFPSDSNPIFIKVAKVAGGKGPATDWIVKQGRVNEFYNGKSGNAFASIPKAALLLKGKDVATTEKNLAAHIQDESKKFAETDAGKAELRKIATELFNSKTDAAEPQNEAQADVKGKAAA